MTSCIKTVETIAAGLATLYRKSAAQKKCGKYLLLTLRVLYHRFVLGDTLKQTAELFGVSRERIRQIEAQALDKIRRRFHLNKSLRAMIKEYGLTVKLNY